MNIAIWSAQILLALLMGSGAIMKFMPIQKIAPKMPWMGEVSSSNVRLLGVLDLLAVLGLILPMVLNIHPQLTFWTAIGIIALMVCAIVFHILRGEKSSIGFNIAVIAIALFIAWGRFNII